MCECGGLIHLKSQPEILYIDMWFNYPNAPRYRGKAKELAVEKGLLKEGQRRKGLSREEIKNEEETVLRRIVEENLNILWVKNLLQVLATLRWHILEGTNFCYFSEWEWNN